MVFGFKAWLAPKSEMSDNFIPRGKQLGQPCRTVNSSGRAPSELVITHGTTAN